MAPLVSARRQWCTLHHKRDLAFAAHALRPAYHFISFQGHHSRTRAKGWEATSLPPPAARKAYKAKAMRCETKAHLPRSAFQMSEPRLQLGSISLQYHLLRFWTTPASDSKIPHVFGHQLQSKHDGPQLQLLPATAMFCLSNVTRLNSEPAEKLAAPICFFPGDMHSHTVLKRIFQRTPGLHKLQAVNHTKLPPELSLRKLPSSLLGPPS